MKTIYKYVRTHTEFGKLFNFPHLSWEVCQHACYVHVCISKHMVNKGGQCANHIWSTRVDSVQTIYVLVVSTWLIINKGGQWVRWVLLMEDSVGARLSEYA